MKPFPSASAPKTRAELLQTKQSSQGCSPKQSLGHGCAGPHTAGQSHCVHHVGND